ncbi:hypothetical protein ADUPG1_007875 [Aduncisulcus paluster]|uniref:EGF-like domain-containing protein n=1 Tax=Aduncisulcus paluster TaxID=2918883 RepID=A0ABQ5KRB7_9EUKA|nr:hypothetical protein ADUPG1_007875 [Aduncisulcus paluster]
MDYISFDSAFPSDFVCASVSYTHFDPDSTDLFECIIPTSESYSCDIGCSAQQMQVCKPLEDSSQGECRNIIEDECLREIIFEQLRADMGILSGIDFIINPANLQIITNIVSLSCSSSSSELSELSGIEFLINLEKLDLSNVSHPFSSIDGISYLSNLNYLNLSSIDANITDYSPLLPVICTLEELYLVGHSSLYQLPEPVCDDSSSLTKLDISSTQISSLNFMSSFPNLDVLILQRLALTDSHLHDTVWGAITELDLSYNCIQDPSHLYDLRSSLLSLNLSYNAICTSNIDGLVYFSTFLPLLTTIDISNNSPAYCNICEVDIVEDNEICEYVDYLGSYRSECPFFSINDNNTNECTMIDLFYGIPSCIDDVEKYDNIQCAIPLNETEVVSLCKKGWYGDTCEDECPFSVGKLCGGVGNCILHECECPDKYYGDACEYVYFDDTVLQSILCGILMKDEACSLTPNDMKYLPFSIDISGSLIEGNFVGMEFAIYLEELSISNCEQLVDLTSIDTIPNLSKLDVSNSQNIADISILGSLKNLSELSISQISDISNLPSLITSLSNSLRYLDVSQNSLDSNCIDSLNNLSLIETLFLKSCDLSSIPNICSLSNTLQELDLSDNTISNLNGLSCLTNLSILNFSNNDITSISNLEFFSSLIQLDISHNSINSLYPLLSLSSLQLLDISYNNIYDLVYLYDIADQLDWLDIRGNYLGDELSFEDLFLFFPDIEIEGYSQEASLGAQNQPIISSSGINCPNPMTNLLICQLLGFDDNIPIVELACSPNSVRIINENGISCHRFDSEIDLLIRHQCMFPLYDCFSVYYSNNSIQTRCSSGYYGEECLELCPLDDYGFTCAGSYSCNSISHRCECPSGLCGELCSITDVNMADVEDIHSDLLQAMCTSYFGSPCDETVLVSFGSCEAANIVELTIPSSIESLVGLEYCERLELLIFENNTSVTDFSPIFSLSNLITIVFPDNLSISHLETLKSGYELLNLQFENGNINASTIPICLGLCSLTGIVIADSINEINEYDFFGYFNYLSQWYDPLFSSSAQNIATSLKTISSINIGLVDPSVFIVYPAFENIEQILLQNNHISDIGLIIPLVSSLNYLEFLQIDSNYLPCASCISYFEDLATKELGIDISGLELHASYQLDSSSSCGSNGSVCDFEDNLEVCSPWANVSDNTCSCMAGTYSKDSTCTFPIDSVCMECGGVRGECIINNGDDSIDCECYDGWYGDNCTSLCPNGDNNLICSGSVHGICDYVSKKCICEEGYLGSACQLSCDHVKQCNDHGTCSTQLKYSFNDILDAYIEEEVSLCICEDTWYGDDCANECPFDTNDAEITEMCGLDAYHGQCNTDTHLCECYEALNGDACQYVDFVNNSFLNRLCDILEKDPDCLITPKEMNTLSESLDLSNMETSNFQGLRFATQVTSINLSNSNITDISELFFLRNSLSVLDLSVNPDLVDISMLESFVNLSILDISGTNVTDISPLSNLSNISSIDISNTSISRIVSELYNSRYSLQVIILDSCINLFSNVGENEDLFGSFCNLSHVSISNCGLTEIPDFSSSSSTLLSINISNNAITCIKPLYFYPFLVNLDLSNNVITDLSPLFLYSENITMPLTTDQIECPNPFDSDSLHQVCHYVGIDDSMIFFELGCANNSFRDVSLAKSDLSCIPIEKESILDEWWYGDDCQSPCPVDIYGRVCGSSEDNNECNYDSHRCECGTDGKTGSVCSYDNVLMSSLDMSNDLLVSMCDEYHSTTCNLEQISSLTISHVSSLTHLLIPSSVDDLNGIEFCESLEFLEFEPGNEVLSSLQPLSSLSSLYFLSIDDCPSLSHDLLTSLIEGVNEIKNSIDIELVSSSICIGLCSLRILILDNTSSLSIPSLSENISIIHDFSKCFGDCFNPGSGSYHPLSSSLTHLSLSSTLMRDPSIISLLPAFSGLVDVNLSNNEISDIILVQMFIDELPVQYIDVSKNRIQCGTNSECFETLNNMCLNDLDNSNIDVVFDDQKSTDSCGSSIYGCDYQTDHLVCGPNFLSNDDDNIQCLCGSGYIVSQDNCEAVQHSVCTECGGERGTCSMTEELESFECVCNDGWYGLTCEAPCPVDADSVECSGNIQGYCDISEHKCVCSDGFYGSYCQYYESSSCVNGHWIYDNDSLQCICDAGWNGSSCDIQVPVITLIENDVAVDYICGKDYAEVSGNFEYLLQDDGTCGCSLNGFLKESILGICIDPATHPDYCDIDGNDIACVECGIDESSHGSCQLISSTLKATCMCETGWSGRYDSVEMVKSCSILSCGIDNLCSNNGLCVENDGEYSCGCNEGWIGSNCDMEYSNTSIFVIIVIILISVFVFIDFIVYFVCIKKKKSKNEVEEIDRSFENQNDHGLDEDEEIVRSDIISSPSLASPMNDENDDDYVIVPQEDKEEEVEKSHVSVKRRRKVIVRRRKKSKQKSARQLDPDGSVDGMLSIETISPTQNSLKTHSKRKIKRTKKKKNGPLLK